MDGHHPRRFTARGPRALTGRLSSGDAMCMEGGSRCLPHLRPFVVMACSLGGSGSRVFAVTYEPSVSLNGSVPWTAIIPEGSRQEGREH